MPTYKAKLSESSIDNLIKNLGEYKNKVDAAPQKIVKSLVDIGTADIEKNIHNIKNKDGNDLATAGSYFFRNIGFAYMQGEQASYLEFGTGEKGSLSPHPQSNNVGWNYLSGQTIQKIKNGKYMWKYRENGTGKWLYTNGIPAGLIVLNAGQGLRTNIVPIAKEALK